MELLRNRMAEPYRKGPVHDDDDDLVHSSSSGISSGSSMESDSFEEETSSNFLPSSSNNHPHDSLSDMSSLFQQLPIKMGLSRHYEGKSRSFTSLASVRGLEDLRKEENAEKKKKKRCRGSYGGRGLWRTNALSRHIGKREWNSTRRPSIPPPAPHRSTTTATISNQTPLFA